RGGGDGDGMWCGGCREDGVEGGGGDVEVDLWCGSGGGWLEW
ncbi:hypothetical protein Tco_1226777, partial [Tanacetum coccineum]